MYTFTDLKRKKVAQLNQSVIVNFSSTMASGATLPLPQYIQGFNEMEQVLGGSRQQPRNDYLGITLTKPSDNCFFVGVSWIDHGDGGQHDEDLVLFTEVTMNNFIVERIRPSEIKKRFPEWDDYHHGDKSHLK